MALIPSDGGHRGGAERVTSHPSQTFLSLNSSHKARKAHTLVFTAVTYLAQILALVFLQVPGFLAGLQAL